MLNTFQQLCKSKLVGAVIFSYGHARTWKKKKWNKIPDGKYTLDSFPPYWFASSQPRISCVFKTHLSYTIMCLILFYTQNDSTIFKTKLYNNLLKKIKLYSLLDSAILVHAVNRLETSSQGLLQTDLSSANGMRKMTENPKPVAYRLALTNGIFQNFQIALRLPPTIRSPSPSQNTAVWIVSRMRTRCASGFVLLPTAAQFARR